MNRLIRISLIITSLLIISSYVLNIKEIEMFTKPLLVPILIYYVYKSSIGKVSVRILLLAVALIFSWLGDVTLMFQANPTYFLLGIGFFLIAQLIYIIVLFKSNYSTPNFSLTKILPFIIYAVVLFQLLLPNAGEFKIPILVYGIIITVMAGMASLRKNQTTNESYKLGLFGSILFVLSDSILAINKFYLDIPLAGVLIMSTYIVAQYLLTEGILRHPD